MIIYHFVSKREAQPFIDELKLKYIQDINMRHVSMYGNDEAMAVISGPGRIRSCAALAMRFSSSNFQNPKFYTIVHVGTVGTYTNAVPGELYQAVKITENTTGRIFFPDMVFKNDFKKCELITADSMLEHTGDENSNRVQNLPVLYDLEGSGFLQGCEYSPIFNNTFIFKIVSSNGADISTTVAPFMKPIHDFVTSVDNRLNDLLENYNLRHDFVECLQDVFSIVSKSSFFTESLCHMLFQMILYRLSMDLDCKEILKSLDIVLQCDPPKSKKQLHEILLEFRNKFILDTTKKEYMLFNGDDFESKQTMADFAPLFSTVYIEKDLLKMDLSKYKLPKDATIVPITHYKDVFNEPGHLTSFQKKSPALILAKQTGKFVFPGAPVCQSFGNEHFYYCSCVKNCIYNCEYCYLHGMYPSGNIVVFVNIEDAFNSVRELVDKHPVYLCVSYDTDLLALEGLLGYVQKWVDLVAVTPNLTIEVRTKSANAEIFGRLCKNYAESVLSRVIFAWTISPDQIVSRFENNTPSSAARLRALKAAHQAGFPVRICFDPLILVPDYESLIKEMITTVFNTVSPDEIKDFSIGTFRISSDYLKKMRNSYQISPITNFPYISENGVAGYGELGEDMEAYALSCLLEYVPVDKVFFWKENE